jgi:putative restriction endonuclease
METFYPGREPFVANTDRAWFDYLSSRSVAGAVDEVNFWSPNATRPMRTMRRGDPVFFRLKKPEYAIAGYGFFAHFQVVDLPTAWATFGWKNGDPHREQFLRRVSGYRSPSVGARDLGCTILRGAVFWSRNRWIPWGEARGWKQNIVQGRAEQGGNAALLSAAIREDARGLPEELSRPFVLVDGDDRSFAAREVTEREGQGVFRLQLLQAYGDQCAITGEHTKPVLDAAHIQPYLGPASNHVQNGLVLTKEFHTLYYEVKVSERLRTDWQNGTRYYPYDGQKLRLPGDASQHPSKDALAWHLERRFLRTG